MVRNVTVRRGVLLHPLARRQREDDAGEGAPHTGIWVGAAAPGTRHDCPGWTELSKDWISLVIIQRLLSTYCL